MLFFQPWVGSHYSSGGIFGKRIMALGESHHCDETCTECGLLLRHECNQFTTDVIKSYLDQNNKREGWMSTFLKFERSLVNHKTTPEESKRIWNSILFYNYLQVAMKNSRQAGISKQYQDAANPFFSVLEQYKPELLIVWGVRLWNALPVERWEAGPQKIVEGYKVPNGYYLLSNGDRVRAICVYHPSAGYSWDYWYRVIME